MRKKSVFKVERFRERKVNEEMRMSFVFWNDFFLKHSAIFGWQSFLKLKFEKVENCFWSKI
jgi:hypothetical protein